MNQNRRLSVVSMAVVFAALLAWSSAEAQGVPNSPVAAALAAKPGPASTDWQPLCLYLGNVPFTPWLETACFSAWTSYTVPAGYQAVITRISCRANVATGTNTEFWYRADPGENQNGAESCLLVGGRSSLSLEPGRESVFGTQQTEIYLGFGYGGSGAGSVRGSGGTTESE